MARKFVFLVVGLLLVGCAGGPGERNQHLRAGLDYAYRDARSTVDLAGSLSGPDATSDTLTRARNQLQSTRDQQNKKPSPDHYRSYAEIQELARRALLDSFQSRLAESDDQVDQLKSRIGTLEDEKAKDRETLRGQLRTLKNRSKRQKQTLRKIKSRFDKSNKTVRQLAEKLEKTTRQLKRLNNRLNETEGQLADLRDENQRIASLVKNRLDGADVREENGQVFITFQERILFEPGRSYLSESSRRRLDTVATLLKKFSARPVRVYGHTDTAPITESGEFDSNWQLSGQRAINVLKYLVYGQDIEKTRIGAVAFADRRPLPDRARSGDNTQDRRVEVVLMPRDYDAVQEKKKNRLRQQNEELVDDFSEDVNEQNLRVEDGSVYVNLTDQLSFPSARASLNEDSQEVLDQFGPVLEKTDRPIRIQGHTDDLPVADAEPYESNWELSSARSISVVQYLIENFDLEGREIGAVAMGQFHPLVPNAGDENRARNRRVEILLLPNTIHSASMDILE